jgi:hypothetical protein
MFGAATLFHGEIDPGSWGGIVFAPIAITIGF